VTGEESPRRNLGRGLSALLGDEGEDYAQLDSVRANKTVPVARILPGGFQPRRNFAAGDMAAMVASVRERGVLQPILVRRHPNDANNYEIVAGERRWRAAQEAGLHEIPVIIKHLTDSDALEIAIIENVQRQDLLALEEAAGYRRLMTEYAHTQENLAKVIGKSRSHVANMLRLLSLPEEVKALLDRGDLTVGHARALLNADDPGALARRVVAGGLNVRQTERLVQAVTGAAHTRGSHSSPKPAKDVDTLALERELSIRLGLVVAIQSRGKAGEMIIRYQSLEQLDEVVQRLSQRAPV
jgi:ParB family chromosome partitioning protein